MDFGDLPFPTILDLFEYWQHSPPSNESLALLASAFTSWEPNYPPKQLDAEELSFTIRKEFGGKTMPLSELPEWMKVSLAAMQSETPVTQN